VDETATGSVNSFWSGGEAACPRQRPREGVALRQVGSASMHLRMPSIDRGVQAFLWALVFFLFLYFGMVLIAVSKGTAFVLSLVIGFGVFLYVRTSGDDDPRDRTS
jgi:hypothetical protein